MHHSFAPLLPIASRNNFRWLPSEVVSEAFELPDDVITQQKSTQALRNSAFRQAALCCVSLSGCESIMNYTCIRSGRQVKVSGAGRGDNNCVKKNHMVLQDFYIIFSELSIQSFKDLTVDPMTSWSSPHHLLPPANYANFFPSYHLFLIFNLRAL